MVSRTFSATMVGLTPIKIQIETETTSGIPTLVFIGLASKSVEESRERITSSLTHSGIRLKTKRTVVNLAPADLHKKGSNLELAIAVSLAQLQGMHIPNGATTLFLGELSLDGQLKACKGVLPLALSAAQLGFTSLVIPYENRTEIPDGLAVCAYPVANIQTLFSYYRQSQLPPVWKPAPSLSQSLAYGVMLEHIQGQSVAKRAALIAAAGRHNLMLSGSPGSGKTLLAQAVQGFLPPLTLQESRDVSTIYSVAGKLSGSLITQRPFRSPHHTITNRGLVGGGILLQPGEISLAHCGVLFLDECTEFKASVLETLRQPLESGLITITNAQGSVTYPAHCSVILALNPCACGQAYSLTKPCTCSPAVKQRYRKKISGPLLDRVDLSVKVFDLPSSTLIKHPEAHSGMSTQQAAGAVSLAYQKQQKRYQNTQLTCNAALTSQTVDQFCSLTASARILLGKATTKLLLSARSYYKTIATAQTIADLDDSDHISADHIAEALQYRIQSL